MNFEIPKETKELVVGLGVIRDNLVDAWAKSYVLKLDHDIMVGNFMKPLPEPTPEDVEYNVQMNECEERFLLDSQRDYEHDWLED